MKKATFTALGVLLMTVGILSSANAFPLKNNAIAGGDSINATTQTVIYNKLAFPSLSKEAFEYAYAGHKSITDSMKVCQRYLLIADFSLPSSEKRFFLIDLVDTTVVYYDYVAHGRNSGEKYANSFSNKPESRQSSLGFYRVSECYYGQHGLSIRLDGLDQCYNDNARQRAIVMHTADYAEPSYIECNGRMGRSWGCPVLPPQGFKEYASAMSGNSLLFIYFPDKAYLKTSVWLQ